MDFVILFFNIDYFITLMEKILPNVQLYLCPLSANVRSRPHIFPSEELQLNPTVLLRETFGIPKTCLSTKQFPFIDQNYNHVFNHGSIKAWFYCFQFGHKWVWLFASSYVLADPFDIHMDTIRYREINLSHTIVKPRQVENFPFIKI